MYIKSLPRSSQTTIDEKFHHLDVQSIGQVAYWMSNLEKIHNVPGDIVECGVGRGRSLLIISTLVYYVFNDTKRNIYGYDSFEGFPEPSEEDNSFRNPKKGEWAYSPSKKYKYTPSFIREILKLSNLPVGDLPLNLVKGFFEDTLPLHPKRNISLLHVDCDLYLSYKHTLENLFHLVSPGGIVIFDDFNCFQKENEKFPGARKAVQEFLGSSFEDLQVSIAGTYYYQKPYLQ